MSGKSESAGQPGLYKGSVRVPGTDGLVEVSLGLDLDAPSVSVRFNEPVGGASRWDGASISVRRLIKYDEVHFLTEGLPEEGVVLQWKTNFSNADGSVAGVIIARPNERRISGETGFVLSRSA